MKSWLCNAKAFDGPSPALAMSVNPPESLPLPPGVLPDPLLPEVLVLEPLPPGVLPDPLLPDVLRLDPLPPGVLPDVLSVEPLPPGVLPEKLPADTVLPP